MQAARKVSYLLLSHTSSQVVSAAIQIRNRKAAERKLPDSEAPADEEVNEVPEQPLDQLAASAFMDSYQVCILVFNSTHGTFLERGQDPRHNKTYVRFISVLC